MYVDTDVEVDFLETEVEINVEVAIIVGDEAGQKVNVERLSTQCLVLVFSQWM